MATALIGVISGLVAIIIGMILWDIRSVKTDLSNEIEKKVDKELCEEAMKHKEGK